MSLLPCESVFQVWFDFDVLDFFSDLGAQNTPAQAHNLVILFIYIYIYIIVSNRPQNHKKNHYYAQRCDEMSWFLFANFVAKFIQFNVLVIKLSKIYRYDRI